MKKKIYFLLSLVLMFTTSAIVITEEPMVGTPYGVRDATGNPINLGEGNCKGCHAGTLNSGGSLTIVVKDKNGKAVNNYGFNELYTVDVTVARSGISLYGFDAEVVTSNNTDAGVISSMDTTKIQTLLGSRSTNITHLVPGKTANSHTFSFLWKTPGADSGEVFIYAAGLAANGNGKNTGDYTYTALKKLKAVSSGIDADDKSISRIAVYPNPVNDAFHLSYYLKNSGLVKVELYALNGQKIAALLEGEQSSGQKTELITLPASLSPGTYFLQLCKGTERSVKKILVR
jgi:hypothetical protein